MIFIFGALFRALFGGGAGGGGGGESRQQIVDPTSGTTNDYVKLLLGICEGDVGGIIGGDKGVYFDKTPFQNADNSYNFKDVSVLHSLGNTSLLQFWISPGGSSSDNPVGVDVKTGVPQTRTISNSDITEIQVRLGFQLQYNDVNGDARQASIGFQIWIKEGINGAFVLRHEQEITARYPDQVAFNYRFAVNTNESYFEVKIVKLYPSEPPVPIPPNTSTTTAILKWISYTEINSDRIAHINTAILGIQFPAKTFQSTPEIWAKLRGMICQIPSNATINTSDNGTDYSGGWNGTFYTPARATADPAWVVWKLLTEPRFNLGIPSQYIDKYALYQCSVYNNQFVSDGRGGQERRFLFNTILGSGGQEVVLETIRAICSSMYTKPYWNGSQISFWQDRPTTVLPKILTNADVEEGKFAYQTPELNVVTTVAKVSYQSIIEDWELIPEIVEDAPAIQRYGVQTEEYALLGETRRGAAIRSGRRTILGSQPSNVVLTCRVRTRAMFFSLGDVIRVSDSAKNRIRIGGLVSIAATNKITIDSPVTLTSSNAKKILLTLPDETVVERTISNGFGTFTEINLRVPLTVLPAVQSPWQIIDASNQTQLYRITEINPVEDNLNLFEITAKSYSANFFTQIETGIHPPLITPTSGLPVIASPPKNLKAQLLEINVNDAISYTLIASWQRPTKIVNGNEIEEPYTDRYRVELRRGELSEWGAAQILQSLSVRWENVGKGTFYVKVSAITTNDKVSVPVTAVTSEVVIPPPPEPVPWTLSELNPSLWLDAKDNGTVIRLNPSFDVIGCTLAANSNVITTTTANGFGSANVGDEVTVSNGGSLQNGTKIIAKTGTSITLSSPATSPSTNPNTSVVTITPVKTAQWKDKASKADFSQPDTSKQPSYYRYGLNNNPALVFDGTSSTLVAPLVSAKEKKVSIFILCNPTGNGAVFKNGNATTGYGLGFGANSDTEGFEGSGTNFVYLRELLGWHPTSVQISNPIICSVITETKIENYINGSVIQVIESLPSVPSEYTSIGGYATRYYNGAISEICLVDSEVSTLDRQKAEGYLAWKWGLESSLPSNHPYKSDRPYL